MLRTPRSQERHIATATLAIVAGSLVLAGCQSYQPEPLPNGPHYLNADNRLTAKPLSLTDIATEAVLRNPDLIASRAKAGVASAQAFAAGLLPDPQFTASLEHPTAAGFANGYALGLSEDLQALWTLSARKAAAAAAADQAKLSLLWDEWQTIEKAESLAVQKVFLAHKIALLDRSRIILSAQAERTQKALAEGNVTLDTAGSDLAASLDTSSQYTATEREALTSDLNLKQLLNLDPTAKLTVSDLPAPPAIGKDAIAAALAKVDKVRPDLLALQAGYKSQEEEVRQAILQQFPAIIFGIDKGSDPENVHTIGLNLSVSLPLFNGARGNIRVQTATRAQLRAEYQARLDATITDAWRIWQEIELLRGQIATLEQKLPEFRRMAEAGARAHESGDISPATYVLLQTSLQARESELLDLKTALWTDTLALGTLLGVPLSPSPPGE